MTHDPLCSIHHACPDSGSSGDGHSLYEDRYGTLICSDCEETCRCDLIAKVRADERNRVFTHLDALADRDHTEGCPSLTCTGCAEQ